MIPADDIREFIYNLYDEGHITHNELYYEYGFTESYISNPCSKL